MVPSSLLLVSSVLLRLLLSSLSFLSFFHVEVFFFSLPSPVFFSSHFLFFFLSMYVFILLFFSLFFFPSSYRLFLCSSSFLSLPLPSSIVFSLCLLLLLFSSYPFPSPNLAVWRVGEKPSCFSILLAH